MRADVEGYGPLERVVEVEATPAGEDELLALDRTSGLVLEVTDAPGIAPDVVYAAALAGSAPSGEPVLAGRFLVTSEGTVRLASLPRGAWTLVIRGERGGVVQLAAEAPGEPIPVALPPGGRLEVTVPDLVGRETVASLTVAGGAGPFVTVDSGGLRREWRVRGGWAALESLPPGEWTVTASSDERSWTGRVTVPAGGGRVSVVLE